MVRKGFIINDELVEDPNGNFYTFDDRNDLKNFLDNLSADVVEDEEMPCKACGATMTEPELFSNGNRCWNCETPWNLI
jgi:hypothetical protein